MKIVGVTGGIAAGKSTVARLFADLGAVVIDADQIGRQVVEDNPEIRQALARAFGCKILKGDGRLNRRLLARRAFATVESRERLNALVHPALVQEIKRQIECLRVSSHNILVVDAALLLEWGRSELVDIVVLVTAPQAQRIQRLLTGKGYTEMEARQRIRAQTSDAEKRRYADYIIDNSGTLEEVAVQVRQVWEALIRE